MQTHTRRTALLVMLAGLMLAGGARAATRTWDGGGGDANWSTPANWDGDATAPGAGDYLIFTAPSPLQLANANDLSSLSVDGLQANTALNGPLSVTGQTLTLGAGGLTNLNVTAGQTVTLSLPLNIGAAQRWYTANDADAVTVLDGGLSGSGTITIAGAFQSNNANKPMFRLGGGNSAYTGTINTLGADSFGLLLFSPDAQTRGLIDLNNGNRNLWLTANDASVPYTFWTGNTTPAGSDPMNVNFRNAGTAGLYVTGGSVYWDPGDGGDYSWLKGTHGHIRLNGSDATYGQMLYLGNSDSSLIMPGDNRGIYDGGGGNNSALVTLLFALADDSGGQRTFTTSARLLVLTRPAVNDANPGKVTISGGSTAVTAMDRLFDGNLNLGGGILVLDGVSWSAFATDRSGGYGSGDNQWQISSGNSGFAARGAPLTIDGSGTTASTFNRSFAFGSAARSSDGLFYADQPVTLSQGIDITSQLINIAAAHTGPGLSLAGGDGIVYTISGTIQDAAGATGAWAATPGSGTVAAETALGELVLSGGVAHTGSSWAGINTTGPNSGQGGLVVGKVGLVRFASPASIPSGALSLSTTALLVGEPWSGTCGYMFTGDADGEVYDLGSQYLQLALGLFDGGGQAGTAQAVFGAHSGQVTLRNTTLNYGMRNNNGASYLLALTRDDSVLTLGAAGAGNEVRMVAAAASGNAANAGRTAPAMAIADQTTLTGRPIIKRGTGTLVLRNVRYTDVAGTGDTTARFAWQLGRKANAATPITVQFDGAVRETAASGSGSLSAFQYQLSGGVLELDATVYPAGFGKNGTSTALTANTVRWGDSSGGGGEGGGGFAAINGDVLVTITNGAGVNSVNVGWPGSFFGTGSALSTGAALMFGSKTGDSTVRLNNDLYLGSAGSGDNTRAVLAVADTNPAKPEAIILGAVKDNTPNNALTLIGDGTLVLAGACTYDSRTRVYGGLLRIDGSLDAATYGITVYEGGTLGGTGSVARSVEVQAGGVLAAVSGASTTGLQITGDLTVDGFVGVRVPVLANGSYVVATVSGTIDVADATAETLPDGYAGRLIVDGNRLLFKVVSDAGGTVIVLR